MTKPFYDSMPKLILSFSYSEFTSINASKWKYAFKAFNRMAKGRTFLIYNSMDVPTNSAPNIQYYDSIIGQTSISSPGVLIGNSVQSYAQNCDNSLQTGRLGTNLDSGAIGIAIGGTLPTIGKIDIYVVEVF